MIEKVLVAVLEALKFGDEAADDAETVQEPAATARTEVPTMSQIDELEVVKSTVRDLSFVVVVD